MDLADSSSKYETALRQCLAESRAIVPEPSVEVLHLVDRAIARQRPFNESGNGFRDAVIWEQVVEEAVRRLAGPVALVSNDRAFGSPGSLSSELIEDLDARTAASLVTLHSSVEEFVRAAGVADPALMAEVVDLAEADAAQMEVNVRMALESASFRWDNPRAEVLVDGVHHRVVVRITGVTAMDDGSPLALVALDVEADVDLYVEPWEVRREAIAPYLSGPATLTFAASALYDREARTLDSLDLGRPALDLEDWIDWRTEE